MLCLCPCMQVQDIVLEVGQTVEQKHIKCCVLHTGCVTVSREPVPGQLIQQQQLQQHVSGLHSLSDSSLQHLLKEVLSSPLC